MKRAVLALSACLLMPITAIAQNAEPIEDEIIVEGERRGADPAMDAWLKGDYVTAEIEFEKNFSVLKKGQTRLRSAIEQNVSDAVGGQLNELANTGSGANAASAEASQTAFNSVAPITTNQRFKPEDENLISSGTDLGGQLYMAGLSELKQGKIDEAKESLKRALFYNETLHDARYRLGLIALGTGERDVAEEQLEKLETAWDRCKAACKNRGDDEILETGVTQLRAFLGRA
ncbi:MAG: tetratricopeptide repeat protein [Pseudomonadota bacterium]